ncbi:MAG: hypothetical protein ABI200_03140, partial [Gaiellales bacterium]
CISCGTKRAPGDPALHLYCGPMADVTAPADDGSRSVVFAGAWTPTPDLADEGDAAHAAVAACWSALDCPSAAPFADPHAEHPSVLARIAVRIVRQARIGEAHVLAAWELSVDGRKRRSASVLLDSTGEVLGVAEALWIEVRPR